VGERGNPAKFRACVEDAQREKTQTSWYFKKEKKGKQRGGNVPGDPLREKHRGDRGVNGRILTQEVSAPKVRRGDPPKEDD